MISRSKGFAAIAGAAAVACGGSRSCPPVPPAPECAHNLQLVEAKNECIRFEGKVAVHALFSVRYAEHPDEPDSRQIYSILCDQTTKACVGQTLRLGAATKPVTIGILDIGAMDEARIIAETGNVVTIKWGPLRTFTADFSTGEIAFVESGEGLITGHTEGRAVAHCDVSKSP
jgi:hypothetical protein